MTIPLINMALEYTRLIELTLGALLGTLLGGLPYGDIPGNLKVAYAQRIPDLKLFEVLRILHLDHHHRTVGEFKLGQLVDFIWQVSWR